MKKHISERLASQEDRIRIFQIACDEVAGMTAAGATTKQISSALNIPVRDVKMIQTGISAGLFE